MSYSYSHSQASITSPHSARPKRRNSNAHPGAALDHSDQEEDDYSKPRSKRNRVARAGSPSEHFEDGAAGGINSEFSSELGGARGTNGGQIPKALSEKEKDARRQARMIRNRNAAQASRDRKKEHTLYLERRVAELEARLNGAGGIAHPLSISTTPYTASSTSSSSASPSKLARSQRSNSVTSSISSSEATRIADLEDENEVLRSQLHLEQTEVARLRARLEALESGTSTPFPSFEPTFAFNTADLKPLPQPEELAFVEQREREKRFAAPLNIAQIPLPSLPDPQEAPSSSSTSALMNLDSSRLVAAEAVQLSLSSSTSSSASTAPSLVRSPSLSASIVSSTPSSVASLDLASTPPSTESYLEDLDHLAPPPMWNEWVKSDPEESSCGVTSGLAFVDFDFLHDGPVVAAC